MDELPIEERDPKAWGEVVRTRRETAYPDWLKHWVTLSSAGVIGLVAIQSGARTQHLWAEWIRLASMTCFGTAAVLGLWALRGESAAHDTHLRTGWDSSHMGGKAAKVVSSKPARYRQAAQIGQLLFALGVAGLVVSGVFVQLGI